MAKSSVLERLVFWGLAFGCVAGMDTVARGGELTPGQWSIEKAWKWYDSISPIKGSNYNPCTSVNSTEMWQAETFDPETIDQELGWAWECGYNSSICDWRGSNELFAIHGGPSTHQYTAFFVKVVKDLRRCIDYLLQKRSDIDGERFAYCGFSTGGSYGTIITAVEDRLGASVLAVAGMSGNGRREVNPINYVGRVKVPTLMLNGKYDLNIPYETRIKPMYDLLGELVNNDNKNLKLYETDHFIPREELIKETQRWLDHYLGPVK